MSQWIDHHIIDLNTINGIKVLSINPTIWIRTSSSSMTSRSTASSVLGKVKGCLRSDGSCCFCSCPSSGTPVSQGCWRHSAAVALPLGSNANMGWRNSAKSRANCTSHSYFSVNTSNKPHGFSFVICRNSPNSIVNINQSIRYMVHGLSMYTCTCTIRLNYPCYLIHPFTVYSKLLTC